MNLNDDIVYRCPWLGPLHQLHAGRSRGLIRHHYRLHDNFLLGHLSVWWKCCRDGRVSLTDELVTVFPLIRSVGLKAATASSRAAMAPMFVRMRPSRTRWTISLSWARSDTRTKSIVRPSAGRASA